MVSNITELARSLRRSASSSPNRESTAEFRSKIRADRSIITDQLKNSGRAVFTDVHGNRFLIEREIPKR